MTPSARQVWPALCAALAAALVTSLVLTPAAPAQAQAKKKYAGVKWEYRVFQLDPSDYRDKSDYRQILSREGARKAEAAFEQHVLKYLGQEGWELVTRERLRTNVVYFYLKRRAG